MTGRLRDLADALILGRLPDRWSAGELIAAGEELRELVRDDMPRLAELDEELGRIEQSLIDFGALVEGDKTTGIADLIDALLPPGSA